MYYYRSLSYPALWYVENNRSIPCNASSIVARHRAMYKTTNTLILLYEYCVNKSGGVAVGRG